jgi:RNA polymerase sigma factor (sigma-70 family)
MELAEHLFRQESGRMTAALTRIFGYHNLDLVEDVVQDAFIQALNNWAFHGPPDNPSAWLFAAARRKAVDVLRRARTARKFAPDIGQMLESEWTLAPAVAEAFEPGAIRDEQLRMMFSCCHPQLAEEAQVALILHILCGFGVDEIAAAFLATPAAIEKRITRGKKVLAGSSALFEITSTTEFSGRLPAVQRALYLLFNEGYHGASETYAVRDELCEEAIRLCGLLLENENGAMPSTYALAALMHLHAARLPARIDKEGKLRSFIDQDRASWDQPRIAEGLRLLECSAQGTEMTAYHVEAGIAAVHARAESFGQTDWAQIVELYDALLALAPSPIVALNRAIAIGQRSGPDAGLEAMGAIADPERLGRYPFYFATLGEFEFQRKNFGEARGHFEAALGVARSPAEQEFLNRRIIACR